MLIFKNGGNLKKPLSLIAEGLFDCYMKVALSIWCLPLLTLYIKSSLVSPPFHVTTPFSFIS